jgi:hypothetical protein
MINSMAKTIREQIRAELKEAYELGIAEGERRALNRLVPENISLQLTVPEQFAQVGQAGQYNNCNNGAAVAVGGGCLPHSPISLDSRAKI